MTQIDTGEGPLCLATTEDLWSCRMLGYAMPAHRDSALVTAWPRVAAATRGGDVDGVIFHSDRGPESQNAVRPVVATRGQLGIPNMGNGAPINPAASVLPSEGSISTNEPVRRLAE